MAATEAAALPRWRLRDGTWTVENSATGAYRTFDIATQPEDAPFAPGARLVALLTGPENVSDYTPFAFAAAGPEGSRISVWRSKRGEGGRRSAWEHFADMLAGLMGGEGASRDWAAAGYRLHGEARCVRCHRKLTTPESIEAGIGPVCAGRGGEGE